MKLAINLATRGRPELLLKTIERTLPNISRSDTILMVSVDQDDESTLDVANTLGAIDRRVVSSLRPREDTIAEKWNRVIEQLSEADVYMPMCDDGPILTPGFDERILEAAALFPDGIGVVTNYLENLTFPGIQAVTGKLANLMGYIYPPLFPYWFVDHWLLDISRMIGRDAFADVRLDCATNRPPTQEFREPAFWATFYDAVALDRREQAEHILTAMNEPEWRKAMLRSHWPHWEQHSRMINDLVRQTHGLDPGPPGDERYHRIKRQAMTMLRAALPQLEAA